MRGLMMSDATARRHRAAARRSVHLRWTSRGRAFIIVTPLWRCLVRSAQSARPGRRRRAQFICYRNNPIYDMIYVYIYATYGVYTYAP